MQAFTGSVGKSEVKGQAYEWRAESYATYMMSATNRKGKVQLKLMVDTSDTSGASFVLSSFGFLIGMFLTVSPKVVASKVGGVSPWVTLALTLQMVAFSVLATVVIVRTNRRKLCSQLNTFMDDLVITCGGANRQVLTEQSFDSTAMSFQPQHQEPDPVENSVTS